MDLYISINTKQQDLSFVMFLLFSYFYKFMLSLYYKPSFGLLNSSEDFDVVGRIVETVVNSDTRVSDVINDVSG